MLLAFTTGGCLCIPSDQERMSDIAGSIRRLNANFAYLIPSVAQLLDDETLRSFKLLALGGEAATPDQVLRIRRLTSAVGAYGPAENVLPLFTLMIVANALQMFRYVYENLYLYHGNECQKHWTRNRVEHVDRRLQQLRSTRSYRRCG